MLIFILQYIPTRFLSYIFLVETLFSRDLTKNAFLDWEELHKTRHSCFKNDDDLVDYFMFNVDDYGWHTYRDLKSCKMSFCLRLAQNSFQCMVFRILKEKVIHFKF